jgi:hypothetical protein
VKKYRIARGVNALPIKRKTRTHSWPRATVTRWMWSTTTCLAKVDQLPRGDKSGMIAIQDVSTSGSK